MQPTFARNAIALTLLLIGVAGAQEPPIPISPLREPRQEDVPSVLTEEPKPELERPTVWGEPTEVRVSLYMIDLDEVNSADQNFAASVYYEARWNSPFLKHEGPGPIHRGVTDVWTPRLVIVNQQMAWPAFPGSVEIYPDGEVVHRQKVWGRFSQPLELHDFPLDSQTLTFQLAAAGLLQQEVKMIADEKNGSDIASTFSVPDFDILSWKVEPAPYPDVRENDSVPGLRLTIEIKRRASYFVMKIIVPLCLIVFMSWAPRWIGADQVGTNMGIATTSFLTLVAYLFATTAMLPPVAYQTRMDWFIFLGMILVFASLVQTVASAVLVRQNKTALVEKFNRWSRVIDPVLLLLVLMFAFVL